MEKELKLWEQARQKKGYKMLVVGGKKLEEKTKAVESLYKAVDSVLVGGAVYNVIMAGKGINVGDSVVSEKNENYIDKGKKLVDKVNNLLLAEKVVIAKKDFSDIKIIDIAQGVPKGYMITEIVIDEKMKNEIAKAEVIIWFGNIGISDFKINDSYPFAKGTADFKNFIGKNCYVVVGGGDSVTASQGIENRVISTGGGAAIALYTKGTLDALEALRGNFEYFEKKK